MLLAQRKLWDNQAMPCELSPDHQQNQFIIPVSDPVKLRGNCNIDIAQKGITYATDLSQTSLLAKESK